MNNSINAPIGSRIPGRTAGPLSKISVLAISVGLATTAAHAQAMPVPDPVPDIISPEPVSPSSSTMAPTVASPPASSPSTGSTERTPPVSADRADDLARMGGFDASTAAPEALAQIEKERQARTAAAAKAATARSSASTSADAANSTASNDTNRTAVTTAPNSDPVASIPVDPAIGASGPEVAIPDAENMMVPTAASPEIFADGGNTDWGLLAALAALLGVGGAGAYAIGRRRKSKGRTAAAIHREAPVPASVTEAIMPELRQKPVETEIRPTVSAQQPNSRSAGSNVSTKVAFANFVADLPEFEVPLGRRRVAAAPRPYLGESDLSRPEGYFMAHVDAMPTPQNPFLTRQNRLKRARALDAKLAEMKASVARARRKMDREMASPRPLEPAFS